MNLLDFYVTEILSEPRFEYNKWWLDVNANCCGLIYKHTLMFASEKEAESVKKGYVFKYYM